MFQVLAQQVALETPWLTVFRERVRIDNSITDYYIVEWHDSVQILAVTLDGKIILTREYRHGCRDTLWQLPSGGVDEKESVEQTARRELREETGYTGGEFIRFAWVYTEPVASPDRNFLCAIEGCVKTHEPELGVTETIDVRLVDFTDAINMILSGQFVSPLPALAILIYERKSSWQKNIPLSAPARAPSAIPAWLN